MKKSIRFLTTIIIISSVGITDLYSQQNDEVTFYKHLALSAWNGVFYGAAADFIFNINGNAAAALPVITAGTCALVPLFVNETRTMSSNQLLLTGHGQAMGWAHGMSLGVLITGNNFNDNVNQGKIIVGLGAAASIGLGLVGRSLSRREPWSEGQVAVYRHYGLFTPIAGAFLVGTFSEDIRTYAASTLICGAGGYLLADRINRADNFTRGEMRATQVLTVLNGGLGMFIYADAIGENGPGEDFRPGLILPALGIALGTGVGQALLKDTELTPRQGMTTIFATGLGALIGSGISILVGSGDFNTGTYLIPYVTGTLSFAYIVGKYKKENAVPSLNPGNVIGNWDVSFMPQNYFFNNKLAEKGYMVNGIRTGLQPIFSAKLTF